MGAQWSKQMERRKAIAAERKILADLFTSAGEQFPGSEYRPEDRKAWMSGLDLSKLRINQIVWPGTHDSATNKIGIRFVSRPFAQCQNCSIYKQLVTVFNNLHIFFFQFAPKSFMTDCQYHVLTGRPCS